MPRSSLALALTNAKLDLRVVADVLQDGHAGYFSQYYVVRADGPIRKIEDLKGKRVATNAIGSASDAAMRSMFRKHGIKDADVTTVEANFANMPAMIEGGKVDLIAVLPQFAKGIIGDPKYKVLFPRGRCGRPDPGGDVGGPRRRGRGAPAGTWSISSRTISARCAGSSTRKTATRRSRSPRRRNQSPKEDLGLRLHDQRLLPLARRAAGDRRPCKSRSTAPSNSASSRNASLSRPNTSISP